MDWDLIDKLFGIPSSILALLLWLKELGKRRRNALELERLATQQVIVAGKTLADAAQEISRLYAGRRISALTPPEREWSAYLLKQTTASAARMEAAAQRIAAGAPECVEIKVMLEALRIEIQRSIMNDVYGRHVVIDRSCRIREVAERLDARLSLQALPL